ncbi:MAG: hypothetical protein V4754_08965 [Pseudomonadota bacterium]
MLRYAAIGALTTFAAFPVLTGCATLTESNQQQLLVHTIVDHREVAGAGCLLSNDVGRWFVTTPARVMVRKSAAPLRIDCKMDDVGAAGETVASKPNVSRWHNLAWTAGLGNEIDRDTGAGFDYPSTVIVILQKNAPGGGADGRADPAGGGSVIY